MRIAARASLACIAALALLALLGLYLPGSRVLFLACKPLATIAIIALALQLPGDEPGYRRGVAVGLLFGLGGDVLLMLPGETAFIAGLGSFLIGHVAYLRAYRLRSPLFAAAWPFVSYALLAALVLGWLWPRLPAGLRVPVLAYVALLAAMAAQASSLRTRSSPSTVLRGRSPPRRRCCWPCTGWRRA